MLQVEVFTVAAWSMVTSLHHSISGISKLDAKNIAWVGWTVSHPMWLTQVEEVLTRFEQNVLQLADELKQEADTTWRWFEGSFEQNERYFDCFHLKFPKPSSVKIGMMRPL
jgi:hypothetical protein